MTLSDAVRSVVAVLRRRPDDLLPWYVLGAAVPAIVRIVPFIAIAIGFVYLETTGRLEAALEEFTALETEPPDPEADPAAFEEWLAGFEPIAEALLAPGLLALALVTIAVTIVVTALLYAAVAAGQITACSARLRGNRGSTAGVAGVRRYWLSFLGLYVLELVAWIGVILTVGIGVAVVAGLVVAATGSELVAVAVGLVAVLVVALALAAVRALFAFAPVAVVVDDTTAVGSLSNTVSFVRSSPLEAGFYYVASIVALAGVAGISGALVFVDVAAFVSLVSALLVLPALDLLKTALYNGYRGRLVALPTPDRSFRARFGSGLRRGWAEMVSFVRATPGTHATVVVLALVSFWVGWEAAEPLAGTVETSISARLEGHVPPTATLEFFGNNWMVALTTAFSGVALAIPAIVSLVFNGVVMGVFGRTEVEPFELLAFVIPHGIFEIPAILVATAVGIWLGVVGWRTYRGRRTRTEFADALERAFWVLVGVGILLAVAAVVEGFVSPYYYGAFL